MNQYLIEHKIKTLSQLSQSFDFNGFNFRQWDFSHRNGWLGNAWIAQKKIVATNATVAINKFRKELIPIVDCIAFVSQCYAVVESQSFIIIKQNNNPKEIFFLRHTHQTKVVPLHFGSEEIEALQLLKDFKEKQVFRYIRESTNSSTFYTRLAMLITAMESIAGQKLIKGKKFTNKDYIRREIIKNDDLFEKIFAYGEGIRPQLFHGCEINFGSDNLDHIKEIYNKIVTFFNEKFKTKIDLTIVHPQRTPFGNYKEGKQWLKPKNKEDDINLKNVLKVVDKAFGEVYGKRDREDFDKFLLRTKMPVGY